MNNNKSRLLLLPSLLICLISFYAVNGLAAGNSNQLAYTQALSSDLLSHLASNPEIVQKLPLNTRVQIVERRLAMVSVQVADNPSVQGWLHQKLLDKRPLTLEKALERYEALERSSYVPADHPEKLEWIKKAAALAPDNIDVLDELIETLQSLKQFDRADQMSKRVAELKAAQTAYTQASSSNLRSHSATYAEIVQKLPINTQIKILQKKGEWASVQVVDNESVQGWLHRSLFARQPLSLEEALERYYNTPKASLKKLKWIERAAALAPRDTDVLEELIKTLRSRKLNEKADLVLENVTQLKASRSANN